jgi:two-component system chemotaxis sensor kinase CheA
MADDPLSYFRIEARELVDGLTQGALRIERSGSFGADERRQLLRLAHTLKGAARVVRQSAVADASHALEDVMLAAGDRPDRELTSRMLALIDQIARQLPGDEPPAPEGVPSVAAPARVVAGTAPTDDVARTVRIDLGEVDVLLERVSAAAAQCAGIHGQLLDHARSMPLVARRQVDALDGLSTTLGQLRDRVRQMRLAPAHSLLVPLERAVRDAALSAGVQARFESAGGTHRLDADVLAAVRDALIQLVRNAVAHGIEPAPVRKAIGKNPEGVVAVTVERRGSRIAFVCRDDGRGIDLESLRQAAAATGAVDAQRAARLTQQELVTLLLAGGLSSRRAASQLAGRGVGLELVNAVAARLNGVVTIESTAGAGMCVSLTVPVSLRSLTCLLIEGGGSQALVPLDAVRGVVRLPELEMLSIDGRTHVIADGRPVPFVPLHTVLGRPATADAADAVAPAFAVIVDGTGSDGAHGADGTAAAVPPDSLIALATTRPGEVTTAIVQGLPPLAAVLSSIRVVAVDERGAIVPVLEPSALLEASRGARPAPLAPPSRTARILVVDDSITTRMLEQSILEAAGYDVELAASAEEGLVKAAAGTYDLFLVDVEMPGIDGFEFVQRTRQDEKLRLVPAVLVTSRSAEEDRQRGLDAGARGYVVKGEFDQEVFLRTIRGLVG